MKALVQRVAEASVTIDGEVVAEDFLDLGIGAAGGVDLYAGACLDECGDEGLEPRLVAHAHEDVLYLHPAVDFSYYV